MSVSATESTIPANREAQPLRLRLLLPWLALLMAFLAIVQAVYVVPALLQAHRDLGASIPRPLNLLSSVPAAVIGALAAAGLLAAIRWRNVTRIAMATAALLLALNVAILAPILHACLALATDFDLHS